MSCSLVGASETGISAASAASCAALSSTTGLGAAFPALAPPRLVL